MRTTLLLALITSILLTVSCGSGAVDTREAEAAIRALDEQWSAAAAKNDVDATVSFYAPDAVLLAANAPIVKDPKGIRDIWGGLLGPNTALSWKVTKVEVAKSGDLGYLYGTYELTLKDIAGGQPTYETGKLVEIWRKQPDGKWKCIVDTYNSDTPLPTPPEYDK